MYGSTLGVLSKSHDQEAGKVIIHADGGQEQNLTTMQQGVQKTPKACRCYLLSFLVSELGTQADHSPFLQNCWSQEEMPYQRFKPFISRSVRKETSYHLGAKLIFVQSTKMETCGLKGQVSHEETGP